jgi:hypothetical protein
MKKLMLLCMLFLWLTFGAAQAGDVAPYLIVRFDVEGGHVEVRKMVHQGCELFIATDVGFSYGAGISSIATGRGCK